MSKIIILGDCNVGKSSLVRSLIFNEKFEDRNQDREKPFEEKYEATIGVKFITTTIKGKPVQLWDCSGHSSFSALHLSHFKKANGAIVVFDVNKRLSFENALTLILELKKASSINHVGAKMPLLLVGTKIDLSLATLQRYPTKNGATNFHFISEEEQKERGERLNVTLNARTSAKSGFGVTPMFVSALKAVEIATDESERSILLDNKKGQFSLFSCLTDCGTDNDSDQRDHYPSSEHLLLSTNERGSINSSRFRGSGPTNDDKIIENKISKNFNPDKTLSNFHSAELSNKYQVIGSNW